MNKNNKKPKLPTEIFKERLYGHYSVEDIKIIHAKIDAFDTETIDRINSFGNVTFFYEIEGKFRTAEIRPTGNLADYINDSKMYDFISIRARELQDAFPNATKEEQDKLWAQAEDEWDSLVK